MENCHYLCRKLLVSIGLMVISLAGISQQVPRGLTASNGVYIGFYEYKPTDYNSNPTKKYPLIIFLHGMGERGNGTSDLPNLLNVGMPRYINQGHPMRFFWNGKWETFLVLSPQLSNNYGDWENFYTDEMLAYAKNNMRIDTNRIYLTGLSLGGGGTWRYAGTSITNAQKFAAIAPVCGTCTGVNMCNLANANLPVWAFHANDDPIVGVGCTEGAIYNINACNPAVKPIKTIWPTGNHWIWDRAYDTVYNWQNPNMFEWFLGQDKSLTVNMLPVANAGSDLSISTTTGIATLDGSASTDADGNLVRYIWKKLSGPSAGAITNASSPTTTVTGLSVSGTYQYELTVVDNRTGWKTDIVNVVVNNGPPSPPVNLAPVANAGTDISLMLPSNSTILNGSASLDPDGTITAWAWTQVSGPSNYLIVNNAAASTSLTNLEQGVYEFRLQVTDNAGTTSEDFISITVKEANAAPVAKAGIDLSLTLPVNNAVLDGSNSYDPDGTINAYQWSKIGGPEIYQVANTGGAKTILTNLVQGTYTFVLTVWDNNWIPATDTVMAMVVAGAPTVNLPPVANAGNDIVITLPANAITLNGSASSDPGGTISEYKWTCIEGPETFTISTPGEITTVVYNFGAGTYTFRLRVKDNNGLKSDDTVLVMVKPALPPPPESNLSPLAKAGADRSISLPVNTTVLNAEDSRDPDGTITSYSWSKLSGPVPYFIASPNGQSTNLTNLVQGTYTFRLEVMDNNGATAADTVAIEVKPIINQLPIAKAGNDITLMLPVNSTNLNGSASTDPDGFINNYSWSKISGPAEYHFGSGGNAYTSLTGLVQGTYLFRLQVIDNYGAKAADTIQVVVNIAPNQLPVANAGKDSTVYLPFSSVVLNGSGSRDPDGVITSYNWLRTNGPGTVTIGNATSSKPSVTGLQVGTHTFKLTVKDNKGAVASDDVIIKVFPAPNRLPVANAGVDTSISVLSGTAYLNAKSSNDPDGTIKKYYWKQLKGQDKATILSDTSALTLVKDLTAGEYEFELTVTDNLGAVDKDSLTIEVVNALRYQATLTVFPNPARNIVTIRYLGDASGKTRINLLDISGKIIKTIFAIKTQAVLNQQISISSLKTGMYFVEVIVEEKMKMMTKLIRQ